MLNVENAENQTEVYALTTFYMGTYFLNTYSNRGITYANFALPNNFFYCL